MAAFKRVSETEIQWQDGQKTHSARWFPQLGTLIWSSWVSQSASPMFDEGLRQQVSDFLAHGAPSVHHAVPDEVLNALREMVSPAPQKRTRFKWWKRS